jgi:hypothetical protein
MKLLQALGIVALVLLVTAMPPVAGQVTCKTGASPAAADSLAPPSQAPSTGPGCSLDTHATMSFAGNCLPCGAALLSDQLFPLGEALRDGLDPVGPLSAPSPPFLPWRPPA